MSKQNICVCFHTHLICLRNYIIRCVAIVLVSIAVGQASATENLIPVNTRGTSTESLELPNRIIPTFTLGLSDQPVEYTASGQLTVVCFLATECPLCRLYAPRLNQIASKYATRDVRFIAVSSNDQDTLQDLQSFQNEFHLQFPFLKDSEQSVAREFSATRNPEVFVLDKDFRVRYQGRIDDQYRPGLTSDAPRSPDLERALDALTSNEPIPVPRTQAVGCLITYRKQTSPNIDINYTQHIRPLLDRHCTQCHRQGEIGPFDLTAYDEVVGWGDMMMEVIDNNRMPPWHADDSVQFANARGISLEDKELLRAWVAGGMPAGEYAPAQVSADPPNETDIAWADTVFSMNSEGFNVPAEGTVEYQYFVVDPKFTEDRWIGRAEVIPGNRSVVHHIIVFVRPPDGEDFRNIGLLSAYVPGQMMMELPTGYAQQIKAGSHLVFQMHYTPNGNEQTDRSSIALQFVEPKSVTHQVYSVAGLQQDFEIPPRESHYQVAGEVPRYPRNGTLLAVAPHMHVRGKSFEITAISPSGEIPLLNVPHYDFNWQHNYVYATPVDLSEIESISFRATFDNSADNIANPEPEDYVTWGDQTWEEMALTFLTVAEPVNTPESPTMVSNETAIDTTLETYERSLEDETAERMNALDKNKDGRIQREEVPQAMAVFLFDAIDRNRDGVVDRTELGYGLQYYGSVGEH